MSDHKLQPSSLMADEPKTMIVIQNSICKTVQEQGTCPKLRCEVCILDADVERFSKWLNNKIKMSIY